MEHVYNEMQHKRTANWNNAIKWDNSGHNDITYY